MVLCGPPAFEPSTGCPLPAGLHSISTGAQTTGHAAPPSRWTAVALDPFAYTQGFSSVANNVGKRYALLLVRSNSLEPEHL